MPFGGYVKNFGSSHFYQEAQNRLARLSGTPGPPEVLHTRPSPEAPSADASAATLGADSLELSFAKNVRLQVYGFSDRETENRIRKASTAKDLILFYEKIKDLNGKFKIKKLDLGDLKITSTQVALISNFKNIERVIFKTNGEYRVNVIKNLSFIKTATPDQILCMLEDTKSKEVVYKIAGITNNNALQNIRVQLRENILKHTFFSKDALLSLMQTATPEEFKLLLKNTVASVGMKMKFLENATQEQLLIMAQDTTSNQELLMYFVTSLPTISPELGKALYSNSNLTADSKARLLNRLPDEAKRAILDS